MNANRTRAYTLILAPLAFLTLVAAQCNEPPPCLEMPETIMGDFNGVLYNPDVGGQMFAYFSDLCVNLDGETSYYSNSNDMQTVVIREEVEGVDLFIIFMANFKEYWTWDGGGEIIVLVEAALESAENGTPIVMDGLDAIAYYWEDGFWDPEGVDPGYMTVSGEISFHVVTFVSGGPVDATYSGDLAPYEWPAGSLAQLGPIPPAWF